MHDNITDYKDSKSKLISGVRKVSEIIKPTYGPAGSNIALEDNLPPFTRVANDGKLITDAIYLEDPIERIGANILREACDKQEREAGDGRKTTVILTSAILEEGIKSTAKPLEIKRSLDECLPNILKAIDSQKKEISVEEVHSVATMSSQNPEIGRIIGEIYTKIGREGIIEIDPSNLPATFYEIVDGVRIRKAGYFGAYSVTDSDKAIYTKPKILISREKITSADQLDPILAGLKKENINELVIYCEDIDMSVASRLAITHMSGRFKTLIIKSPILWKDWLFEDFAKLTGATPIDARQGKTFKNLEMKDLGTCDKIITTKDETRLIGTKDISEHINRLKELSLEDDQQKIRISWLNTKVAILKIGANSESELSYTIKKAKDACNASYYALKDGVVKGGGVSLNDALCGKDLRRAPYLTGIGGDILFKALQVPWNQVMINSGSPTVVFDYGDKVLDPALVVKSAITTAVSIAGIILTTSGAITIPRDKSLGSLSIVQGSGNTPVLR